MVPWGTVFCSVLIQLGSADLACKIVLESSYHLPHHRRRFVYKLQPVMHDAAVHHLIKIPAGDLCFCPENRIAAAHISHHRVDAPLHITQGNAVLFARLAAVQFARAL